MTFVKRLTEVEHTTRPRVNSSWQICDISRPQAVGLRGCGSHKTCGESLVDVVVVRHGQAKNEQPGGSPLNVAVGLAATFATRVGLDARGRRLVAYLQRENIGLLGDPVSSSPTSVTLAHVDDHGVATCQFDITWDLPPTTLPPSTILMHTLGRRPP
ncbi:hypothetical protein [Micromonospora sp. NPDC048830]|uniref:hypothetical protein n=1 Tax=Micromonospora sp. NPDC048830 TaxID=3364257 RepID=UPI0037116544